MSIKLVLVALVVLVAHASAGKHMNTAGLNLVKRFEGWRACYYKDPVGLGTIGYGHLVKRGEPYHKGSCITKAQGTRLLKKDMRTAESCINAKVRVKLSCNQFAALASWAYNVGCGNVASSTLVRVLNQGHKSRVCSELKKWVKGGGRTLPGLVKRRAAECGLFKKGGGKGC